MDPEVIARLLARNSGDGALAVSVVLIAATVWLVRGRAA
jgi:hypothetical protein